MRHALAAGIAAIALVLIGAQTAAAQKPVDNYVWADACKTCHAKHFTAWEKTKHAHAITRLSGGDKDPGKCIGCHVTPTGNSLLEKDVNANIQCEGCHGPGKAHVEAAASGEKKPGHITLKPAESVCVECHSSKSPHFKFFSYAAMTGLVHSGAK